MASQEHSSERRKPFVPAARVSETPEVRQALAKAEENAAKAQSAQTLEDRHYYERMRQKWLGIAEGWRVIDGIDKTN